MTHHRARAIPARARRIVVKVGTSTLAREGQVRPRTFTDLARQVSGLVDRNREIVLVSSGAIAVGARELGWNHPGRSVPEKQAAAAVGQIGLLELYQRRFAKRGKRVAQILVTRSGLENRERFLNARHTLLELLRLHVVPIVNENDTVATEEIRFGDNDDLSATIVNLIGADLLVILTDVDGLYAERPIPGRPPPTLIDVLPEITPEIRAAAHGSQNAFGRGGMISKLRAAETAARSGAATVLCNGRGSEVLRRVTDGADVGTLVLPGRRLASKKHWLAFTSGTRGELVIDTGAARALLELGRSLLPAGILEVRGRFGVGDAVACLDPAGRELARGLAAYSAQEVARIKGRATREIEQVLGYSNGDEVIHRDDLVVLDS